MSPLVATKAAMGTFARRHESKRARFQRRVVAMDRIIRETLAMHA